MVEDIPAVGSVWKHKKGTLYTVIVVANTESDRKDEFPTTVVYRGPDGKVWSRPLYRWHGSMTFAGRDPWAESRLAFTGVGCTGSGKTLVHGDACKCTPQPVKKVTSEDVKVETFRPPRHGMMINTMDVGVRVTHIPTGIYVDRDDDRSQHRNKANAVKALRIWLEGEGWEWAV